MCYIMSACLHCKTGKRRQAVFIETTDSKSTPCHELDKRFQKQLHLHVVKVCVHAHMHVVHAI